jgi:hypothetical protein
MNACPDRITIKAINEVKKILNKGISDKNEASEISLLESTIFRIK